MTLLPRMKRSFKTNFNLHPPILSLSHFLGACICECVSVCASVCECMCWNNRQARKTRYEAFNLSPTWHWKPRKNGFLLQHNRRRCCKPASLFESVCVCCVRVWEREREREWIDRLLVWLVPLALTFRIKSSTYIYFFSSMTDHFLISPISLLSLISRISSLAVDFILSGGAKFKFRWFFYSSTRLLNRVIAV